MAPEEASADSVQGRPPFWGGRHSRCRTTTPRHSRVQFDHVAHSLHMPSTGWEREATSEEAADPSPSSTCCTRACWPHLGKPQRSTAGPESPRQSSAAAHRWPAGCRSSGAPASLSHRTDCRHSRVPRDSRVHSPAHPTGASQRLRCHRGNWPAHCTPAKEGRGVVE